MLHFVASDTPDVAFGDDLRLGNFGMKWNAKKSRGNAIIIDQKSIKTSDFIKLEVRNEK